MQLLPAYSKSRNILAQNPTLLGVASPIACCCDRSNWGAATNTTGLACPGVPIMRLAAQQRQWRPSGKTLTPRCRPLSACHVPIAAARPSSFCPNFGNGAIRRNIGGCSAGGQGSSDSRQHCGPVAPSAVSSSDGANIKQTNDVSAHTQPFSLALRTLGGSALLLLASLVAAGTTRHAHAATYHT